MLCRCYGTAVRKIVYIRIMGSLAARARGHAPSGRRSECLIPMNGDKQAFQGNLAMNGNHTQLRGLRDRQDCRARNRTAWTAACLACACSCMLYHVLYVK